MFINISVSTLEGRVFKFVNRNDQETILEFKHYIYNHHPYLNQPFSKNHIDNLNMILLLEGTDLKNHNQLKDFDFLGKTLLFRIESKSIKISKPKKNTVADSYMISPCSHEEDLFMDSYESDIPKNQVILNDIYEKLHKIEEMFHEVTQKLDSLTD